MDRITRPRMIAFIAALLLPLAAMALGAILLAADTIINCAFIIIYIALPVCTIMLLGLCIFSNKKIVWKVILSVFLLLLFVVLFMGMSAFGKHEALARYENEELARHYTQVENDFDLMPSLSEIGQPTRIEYYDYFSSVMGFFTCDADYLICKYSDAEYEAQKGQLEKAYCFQDGTMSASSYDCEPATEIDGYLFRALSISGEYERDIHYPKRLVFIAYSDDAKEIVYLSFYDDDLDYIVSLTDFIIDDCGWKHIR